MPDALKLLIAHPDGEMLDLITRSLAPQHAAVATCRTAAELAQLARSAQPDLIVTATAFPDGDGIDVVITLGRERPIPAVIVTARRSIELVAKAMRDHVMAYLVEPVDAADLQAAVVVAWTRFGQLRELEEEIGDLREALEHRKVIERAKGILMAELSITEADAFAHLRRSAQDRRVRIFDIAKEIDAKAQKSGEASS